MVLIIFMRGGVGDVPKIAGRALVNPQLLAGIVLPAILNGFRQFF